MASADKAGASAPVARKTAYSPQKLAALMPERIGEWKRVKLGTPVPDSDHEVAPVMQAQYARGNDRADVEVLDMGKAGVLAARQAPRVALESRPTATGTERAYLSHGRLIHEELETESRRGSAGVMLGNGLNVRVSGRGLDGPALQQVIEGIDLAAAAALRRR